MFSYCYTLFTFICLLNLIREFCVVTCKPISWPTIDDIATPNIWPDDGKHIDEDSGFVDDEPDRGSSEDDVVQMPILDSCRKLQQDLVARGLTGAYVPRCTAASADAMQIECFTSGGKCWCVNSQGREVDSNEKGIPKNCTFIGNHRAQGNISTSNQLSSDFEITATSTLAYRAFQTPVADGATDDGLNLHQAFNIIDDEKHSENSSKSFLESLSSTSALWTYAVSEPLYFSVIIFTAITSLIALILCPLCIIYRFRKKDEGSYALDESRPISGRSSSKLSQALSQDREFFA